MFTRSLYRCTYSTKRTCIVRTIATASTRSFTSNPAPSSLYFQHRLLRTKMPTNKRTASTLPKQTLFSAIASHDPSSCAIVHSESGQSYTYGTLAEDIAAARDCLVSEIAQGRRVDGERIAFLVENSYEYVVTFLAIMAANAIALPLAPSFPTNELQYILNQSQAIILMASEKQWEKAQEVLNEDLDSPPILSKVQASKDSSTTIVEAKYQSGNEIKEAGMMLYTSGTTSRPKGVLLPLSPQLTAQCDSLKTAWRYRSSDRLLHCLPLHHIHGTMNALLTPLLAGSTVEFLSPFVPETVWQRFAAPFLPTPPQHHSKPITFFTVVPTIYSRLLDSFPKLSEDVKTAAKKGISTEHLRLAISGSAALPTPTKQAWSELSGNNVLLERYGMTEVGMALSCGLSHSDRIDGSVGWPLPGVECRLVDSDDGETIIKIGEEKDASGKDRQGEIQLRGPTIFQEYFRNPEATKKEFVASSPDDGKGLWFKTGDVAVRREVEGAGACEDDDQDWARGPAYFIAGRMSSDIIKSGGEKVSALEVEREMLSMPQIHEVAVVGIPSAKWGQKVAAVVVLSEEGKHAGSKNGGEWSPLDMRRAMKARLVPYKIPQEMKCVKELKRNAMGKINKKELVKEVWGDQEQD